MMAILAALLGACAVGIAYLGFLILHKRNNVVIWLRGQGLIASGEFVRYSETSLHALVRTPDGTEHWVGISQIISPLPKRKL